MNNTKDTICALATPPGTAGLAIIRLSGNDAIAIADQCFKGKTTLQQAQSHTIHYGIIYDTHNNPIDTVTAFLYKAPHSYTGENTVEFGCHGNMIIVEQILQALINKGATPAKAGQFTQRAFINGKIDLTQVEAVADIIHASSTIGAQTAARQLLGGFTQKLEQLRDQLITLCGLLELELDFTEQDIELIEKQTIRNNINAIINHCQQLAQQYRSAQILRAGFHIALVGYPNAGKSSLFNALLNRKRAIVSHIPGTTRDYIEETLHIQNIAVKITDTAGLRNTQDTIEMEGIHLAQSIITQANLVLIINDATQGTDHSNTLQHKLQQQFPTTHIITVHNKIDLIPNMSIPEGTIAISTKTSQGIDQITQTIADIIKPDTEAPKDILINQRHAQLLNQAIQHLQQANTTLDQGYSNDLIAIDARAAIRILGEITGQVSSEDILNAVFSSFCIGK
jgi:tRNA modification GTPase